MPKIISDLKATIIKTSRPILLSEDYSKLTMRSLAAACGVAVGTLYNYFPSKDMLLANVILEDWLEELRLMGEDAESAKTLMEGVESVYHRLEDFIRIYKGVWMSASGAGSPMLVRERHERLLTQISSSFRRLLNRFEREEGELPRLLSETFLSYTMAERPFELLVPVLHILLQV